MSYHSFGYFRVESVWRRNMKMDWSGGTENIFLLLFATIALDVAEGSIWNHCGWLCSHTTQGPYDPYQ